MTRPRALVAVLGTATGIGKTWVTAALVADLHSRGVPAVARKPVQSFAPDERGQTDRDLLADAAAEPAVLVCPDHRSYPVPMAPPMACDALGVPVPTLAELVEEIRWPGERPATVGFVETVGGVRSPISADGDSRDLAAALQPDLLLLVSDAALGAVDATRLAVDALAASLSATPLLVYLNRFDPADDLHRRNRAWLANVDDFAVVTDLAGLRHDLGARLGATW